MTELARQVLRDVGQGGGDTFWGDVCLHVRKPVTDEEIRQSGWQA